MLMIENLAGYWKDNSIFELEFCDQIQTQILWWFWVSHVLPSTKKYVLGWAAMKWENSYEKTLPGRQFWCWISLWFCIFFTGPLQNCYNGCYYIVFLFAVTKTTCGGKGLLWLEFRCTDLHSSIAMVRMKHWVTLCPQSGSRDEWWSLSTLLMKSAFKVSISTSVKCSYRT